MTTSEPNIVIAHRDHLSQLLSEALQLEHMIMCQYLFAQFSLKDGARDGLTAEQSNAVDRWRTKVRGIAIEEMLHMALVGNLMSAIGAASNLGRPNFPQRSGYFPAEVRLDLLPFGEEALDHFLFLERPEGMQRDDGSQFVETASPRDPVDPNETLPRDQEYATIGHLYRGIADGLRNLSSRTASAPYSLAPRMRRPHRSSSDGRSSSRSQTSSRHSSQSRRSSSRVKAPSAIGRQLTRPVPVHSARVRCDASGRPDLRAGARRVSAAFLSQPFDIPTAQPLITDPLVHRERHGARGSAPRGPRRVVSQPLGSIEVRGREAWRGLGRRTCAWRYGRVRQHSRDLGRRPNTRDCRVRPVAVWLLNVLQWLITGTAIATAVAIRGRD